MCFLSGARYALVFTRGHCGSRGCDQAGTCRCAAGQGGRLRGSQPIGDAWVLPDINHAQYGQLVLPEINKTTL